MTFEEYARKSEAFPLEWPGQLLYHECSRGHLIRKRLSESKKCAWCSDYTEDELLSALDNVKVVGRIGRKAILEYGDLRHVFHVEDLINGLSPGTSFKPKRNILYYIRVPGGYKVGYGTNPFKLGFPVVYFRRYANETQARLAVNGILSEYPSVEASLAGGIRGRVQIFETDVLGLDQ